MNQLSRFLKAALCALLIVAASSALAQMPQPFSADFTIDSSGGKAAGKLYSSPPKMRVEMTSAAGASKADMGMLGNVSVIFDGATQTSYVLMPQQSMFMELHGERQNMISPGLRDILRLKIGSDPCASQPGTTCKKLGTETVSGRSCEIWEITSKDSGKTTMWVDQKLHFPVRVKSAEGGTVEFTNIKDGPQSASLFSVPAGYKPFDPSAFGGRPH